ncbi:YciI-like protein [Chelativorans sp. YIM 93263]|uniref:YciI-like protein n=1 Tax=Chelativorans sp. YIM 93263 TaxID=2906648 RepID=UPI002377EC73|nr:YciI-like protein [Chelativorans sp. YIM 93263]
MIFIILCQDKPDHLQLRLDTRSEHLGYLEKLNAEGTLKLAGPFLDEDGNPSGSMVAVEAPDRDAAEAIAKADPYALVGLFKSVEIRRWNWVLNKPENA